MSDRRAAPLSCLFAITDAHSLATNSLGLVMLEAGGNVILPDNGEAWQKLRNDDFTDVDLSHLSDQLVELIFAVLDSNPDARPKVQDIVEHPILQAVMRRMCQGVTNSELDQLPDFELPTIESGPASGHSVEDSDAMDTEEDGVVKITVSAPQALATPSALGLVFHTPEGDGPKKVLDIRGALIQEPEEEFMYDVLSAAASFAFEVAGPHDMKTD